MQRDGQNRERQPRHGKNDGKIGDKVSHFDASERKRFHGRHRSPKSNSPLEITEMRQGSSHCPRSVHTK
jgi:hypothetical protein